MASTSEYLTYNNIDLGIIIICFWVCVCTQQQTDTSVSSPKTVDVRCGHVQLAFTKTVEIRLHSVTRGVRNSQF